MTFSMKCGLFAPLLFLVLVSGLSAQKNYQSGYLILKSGDTLKGEIDYREWGINPKTIDFRNDAAKIASYTVLDIKGFAVGGDEYVSRTIKLYPYSTEPVVLVSDHFSTNPYSKTAFFRVLTKGSLNLYQYKDSTGTEYFFASRGDNGLEQLRLVSFVVEDKGRTRYSLTETFKDQLQILMRDCAPASKRISQTHHRESDLRRLFFAYNHCGADTAEKPVARNRGALYLYPVLGYFSSKVRIGAGNTMWNGLQFPAYSSLTGGAGILFTQPRNREKFSFLVELLYQHFYSHSPLYQQNMFTTGDAILDYDVLKGNILLRYCYPEGKLRPFIKVGMANTFMISNKSTETSYDNVDHSSSQRAFLGGAVHNYEPGMVAGLGARARRFHFETRFEINPGMSDVMTVSAPVTTVYFLASFSL